MRRVVEEYSSHLPFQMIVHFSKKSKKCHLTFVFPDVIITKNSKRMVLSMERNAEYCQCQNPCSVTTEFNDWFQWDVCCNCGKEIEMSREPLNHYDGEDHVVDWE